MIPIVLEGLKASDPLGFLGALGTLRVVAREYPSATMRWVRAGEWHAELHGPNAEEVICMIWRDVQRWRRGHLAVDFAREASPKVQDLKHPPEQFRELMRQAVHDPEAEPFIAAFATGVAVDGAGQTKPTSLHFTAGRQRFMDAVVSALTELTCDDITEALFHFWKPRSGKNLRWRAASERSRALLSYDPGKEKATVVIGALWLAFQAMPLLPVAPQGRRVVTTGFTRHGRREAFVWPIWIDPLTCEEVRIALAITALATLTEDERRMLGIAQVFRANVLRSSQGYGNFAAATPV